MESTIFLNPATAEAERDESIGGIVITRQGLAREVAKLSAVDDWRFIEDLLRQWVVIGIAVAAAILSQHWAVYLAAILVISTRQHALGVLMHDGTHYRLLSSRGLNDAVCDLFCAFPVGMMTSRYRYEHLLHHRFLNTDRDPYWVDYAKDEMWHWPKSTGAAIWVFAKDLLGMNSRRWGAVLHRWSPWANHFSIDTTPPPLTMSERLRFYAWLGALVLILTITHAWLYFLLLWILPLSTVTLLFVRIRTIGEHLGIPNRTELDASRHTDGTLFEHLTVAPFNINYHIDHHLFPSVPYFNLPALHDLLLQNRNYTNLAILNQTYFGLGPRALLRQILRRPKHGPYRYTA